MDFSPPRQSVFGRNTLSVTLKREPMLLALGENTDKTRTIGNFMDKAHNASH